MKVYCKRNYFYDGKLKWERGKAYDTSPSNEWELNVYCYIKHGTVTHLPISKKEFDKYFIPFDEWRNDRINKILNE